MGLMMLKQKSKRRVFGTPTRPRLSVFRSNKHIYAQIIDDTKGITLVSANDFQLDQVKETKQEIARAVGRLIGERAIKKKIKKVVFDRGRFKYHGRIKALAEGAREAGLIF